MPNEPTPKNKLEAVITSKAVIASYFKLISQASSEKKQTLNHKELLESFSMALYKYAKHIKTFPNTDPNHLEKMTTTLTTLANADGLMPAGTHRIFSKSPLTLDTVMQTLTQTLIKNGLKVEANEAQSLQPEVDVLLKLTTRIAPSKAENSKADVDVLEQPLSSITS